MESDYCFQSLCFEILILLLLCVFFFVHLGDFLDLASNTVIKFFFCKSHFLIAESPASLAVPSNKHPILFSWLHSLLLLL